ncbi:hypothetical protein [Tenacibaculum singaporense]|uniref:hypothetical protein n=1 Tax=Tenacibaculum singaporense TaxID=2358479 RepID=UPI000F66F3F5|nr:hypothetical protein [Tenacibaculum singaporense]RSC96068.1 hypothetical protein EI424_02805 [Tenacibaculum singaporense]
MTSVNFSELEKKAGRKAALQLRKSLKNLIQRGFETTKGNSAILKSTVLSKMDGPELQRLVIKMPHYGFKHHFGFDGVRSNGVKLRLHRHEGFLTRAVSENNVLENLATEIGNIRADEVATKINF